MKTIVSQIEISAPPKRVWDVLTDFDSYGQWNPFMDRVRGRALPGADLWISMQRRGGRHLSFRARVLVADPPRELTWEGRSWGYWPGLMRGERQITIEPLPGNRTMLRMRTTFTGLLSPLMRWVDAYRGAFEDMERALKARAEAG